jgi:hypothetical protein
MNTKGEARTARNVQTEAKTNRTQMPADVALDAIFGATREIAVLRAALRQIADASTGAMDQSGRRYDNIHTLALKALEPQP